MDEDVVFVMNPEFIKMPLDILKLELILFDLEPLSNFNKLDYEVLIERFCFSN
jgi:hypothetical protein